MTLANVLFVLVLASGLATLVVLVVGILSMGRDPVEAQAGASRSNRLMASRAPSVDHRPADATVVPRQPGLTNRA